MARYTVAEDIAILDKGEEEVEIDRFIPIVVKVDDNGSPDEAGLNLIQQVMATQCANPEHINDSTKYFNKGDVIYTSATSGKALHKFMIETDYLVPSKLQISMGAVMKDTLESGLLPPE